MALGSLCGPHLRPMTVCSTAALLPGHLPSKLFLSGSPWSLAVPSFWRKSNAGTDTAQGPHVTLFLQGLPGDGLGQQVGGVTTRPFTQNCFVGSVSIFNMNSTLRVLPEMVLCFSEEFSEVQIF